MSLKEIENEKQIRKGKLKKNSFVSNFMKIKFKDRQDTLIWKLNLRGDDYSVEMLGDDYIN
jgi:hypothetical protein